MLVRRQAVIRVKEAYDNFDKSCGDGNAKAEKDDLFPMRLSVHERQCNEAGGDTVARKNASRDFGNDEAMRCVTVENTPLDQALEDDEWSRNDCKGNGQA